MTEVESRYRPLNAVMGAGNGGAGSGAFCATTGVMHASAITDTDQCSFIVFARNTRLDGSESRVTTQMNNWPLATTTARPAIFTVEPEMWT